MQSHEAPPVAAPAAAATGPASTAAGPASVEPVAPATAPVLEVRGLTVCYDTAMLLNDVSLSVGRGEFVGLVGPNGAGKTTLLRTIAGLVRWEKQSKQGTRAGNITIEGEVRFEGERIDALAPHAIARRGLVLCPERRRPFTELTVADNLMAGAYLQKDRRVLRETRDMVHEMFPVLKERARQISGTLSGGEQQMLAIGRSLMTRPRLLCIDEPSTGLSPRVKKELFAKISEINRRGITVLLVEQDTTLTLQLCARSYVLSHSRVVASGTREALMADQTVQRSYLGLQLPAGKPPVSAGPAPAAPAPKEVPSC